MTRLRDCWHTASEWEKGKAEGGEEFKGDLHSSLCRKLAIINQNAQVYGNFPCKYFIVLFILLKTIKECFKWDALIIIHFMKEKLHKILLGFSFLWDLRGIPFASDVPSNYKSFPGHKTCPMACSLKKCKQMFCIYLLWAVVQIEI